MAKFIFFTDFHAHDGFTEFSKPDEEYGNDRFRAQMETLQRVFDIARENGATILFGGDLFHKRGAVSTKVFNHVIATFDLNKDIPMYLLVGNHDMENNKYLAEHSLEAFNLIPNVKVLNTFDEEYLTKDGGLIRICAVPFCDDTELTKHKIREFAEKGHSLTSSKSILLGHIGVDGAKVGKSNHILEGAYTLGDLYPDSFDYVLLGHYHKWQFIGGRDNVIYGGNTIQNTFSDEGQPKGVWLVDTDKTKPEFIEIPNKMFYTLREITEDTQELVDNHYVRLILDKEQAKQAELYKETNDNFRLEVAKEFTTETRIDIDVESTEAEITKAYAEEYYPESVDLALDVLKEALSN